MQKKYMNQICGNDFNLQYSKYNIFIFKHERTLECEGDEDIHAENRLCPIFYNHSFHTDGQTDMANSTMLVILIKNI